MSSYKLEKLAIWGTVFFFIFSMVSVVLFHYQMFALIDAIK